MNIKFFVVPDPTKVSIGHVANPEISEEEIMAF